MSSIRNPVGPQPPAVYWRRRLLVAVGLIAVIVVIVLIVVRPGSGTPGANPSGTPSHSTTPSPSGTAASGTACDPAVITLTAVTDAAKYPTGQQPLLSMTITNSGAVDCTFDVGTDAQEYVITSGADRIWSSKDCQTAPAANQLLLKSGVTQSTTPFAWDRTRSSTTTCSATNRPAVTAGGASYHLQVHLGDATVADKQFLLQ